MYLTAIGAKGTVKATKERIGLDELFVLEDSHPQVKLKAYNGRRVSVRAGVEVSANQDDVTDAEYFQLEINPSTKLVCHMPIPCDVECDSRCAVVCAHPQEPPVGCW